MFEKYIDGVDPYIIAEVGQNHQGEVELAEKYIETFARLGASAVKFQMRDNEYLFTERAFNRPYDSDNSFGETYGEHRNYLEFSDKEWELIRISCKKHRVDFMCTPFDEPSLNRLIKLNVDVLKVASFDLGNIPFISKLCDVNKPIVISVGGGRERHIGSTVEYLQGRAADFSILHCVSEYPCPPEKLGLNRIQELSIKYPGVSIGLSDHFNGTLSGPLGYAFGARVFEKHVTFNRANKGTDHSFALEPRGFESFVRDIRRVPQMQRSKNDTELGEEQVFQKLGKSLCAAQDIEIGEKFTLDNIRGVIDISNAIPVRESALVLNREAKRRYSTGQILEFSELENGK